MSRSKSSHRWLQEHEGDHYVQRARVEKLRSRAAFKLLEIDKKDKLFKPGIMVVDLGAAPGGWCEVIAQRVGDTGRVFALDKLDMMPVSHVEFIQGDFTDDTVLAQLVGKLAGGPVDLVLSDMAPNLSGQRSIDQPRSMYLAELALDFCQHHLRKGGKFLVKAFQGEGFDEYLKALRANFTKVVSRKPDASRDRSREVYLLGLGFKSPSSVK